MVHGMLDLKYYLLVLFEGKIYYAMRSIAVLASGNGTNFQAIIEAVKAGVIGGSIAILLSDRKDAYALHRAEANGIPSRVIPFTKADPEIFYGKMRDAIRSVNPDLMVLAGFNRILPDRVLSGYRAINIHPSLLPCFGGRGFYGLKVHEAVLASGAKFSGCTVHFVTGEVDGGPIILQRIVEVMGEDTPETLADRIHHEEHIAIVEAIRIVLEGNYTISGNRVLKS